MWIAHTGDAIRVPYLRRLAVVAVAVVDVVDHDGDDDGGLGTGFLKHVGALS